MPVDSNIDRRRFHGAMAAGVGMGLAGLGMGRNAIAANGARADLTTITEPERQIKVVDDVDVIVCGGGPAGFSAAIAAARSGASVRLLELNGCLGGVWTAGLLTYVFDFDKPGLTRELTRELKRRDARDGENVDRFTYHVEEMKCLLEEMVDVADVKVRLHTRVVAVQKNQQNKMTTILTESKSGREAWRAKTFIDATGDGDVGALAGCDWQFGREENCPCQPMTMNALVSVPDVEAIKDFVLFYGGADTWNGSQQRLLAELKRAGVKPSYGAPTLFHLRGNVFTFMANHEYGIKPFDANQVTDATMRSRSEIYRMVKALRSLGAPWKGLELVATAEQIGIRDGRRISGRYLVNRNDLIVGRKHEDGIARVTFNVDIHADTQDKNDSGSAVKTQKVQPYDIPVRALIAKDVDGLMTAGRCISGDFIAHASYRVTGNAVAMGEAAGLVSAIAARTNRLPHEVPWASVAPELANIRQRSK